jgi:hypothetical protein
MGLSSAAFSRFGARVDAALAEVLPALVSFAGQTYAASTAGGSWKTDYAQGGMVNNSGGRTFRISKSLLAIPPRSGDEIIWIRGASQETLRVKDAPQRPHEASWIIICEPVDR